MTNHIYRPTSSILVVAVIILLSLFLIPEGVAHAGSAETFVVNSQGDEGDADLTDDICSTTLVDLRAPTAVNCTLRAAIEQANARPFEMDNIVFKINGFILPFAATIEPSSPLPTISAPVAIDGTTQPVGLAAPICSTSTTGTHNILITLNGISAGTANGLHIAASAPGTRIQGLAIINFNDSGILSEASSTEILCNHIGIQRDGATAAGNGANGITLINGNNQEIGSTFPKGRNVISGNTNSGIRISTSDNNSIYGNYIGVDEDAADAVPNSGSGIYIIASTDTNVGSSVGPKNIISGNGAHGIQIHLSSSEASKIYRNHIGTDRNGSAAIGNTLDGINIEGGVETEIGGYDMFSLGNVISGNHRNGINLRFGTTDTYIYKNLIGTQISPEQPLPNGGNGIEVLSSESNYIGYSDLGNTIAFNVEHGIKMRDGSNDNYVVGNIVRGNGESGIYIDQSSDNQIGEHGSGNTILGNTSHGIAIIGASSTDTLVQGNFIGYDIDLDVPDGNDGNGILINNAASTTIGITPPPSGDTRALAFSNFISSNAGNGIHITGNAVGFTKIDGNVIGSDFSLETALGNGGHGVLIDDGATLSLIGNEYANVIAFNDGAGIAIVGSTTRRHRISPNNFKGNGGLMIDLENDGKTVNDSDDSDSGANDLQNYPVVTNRSFDGSTIVITGTLATTADTLVQLDFYTVISCDGGVGDGAEILFSRNVSVGSDGNVNFTVVEGLTRRAALFGFVAITATDPGGNTSEFSDCIEISSVPLAVGMISAETISPKTAIPLLTILLLLLTIQPLRSKRHSRP